MVCASKCEALLHSTILIFGIDVLRTCPRTLAWLGLGRGLRLGLSLSDKFGKLSGVDRPWLDNYSFIQ